jgi:hypothetical protein
MRELIGRFPATRPPANAAFARPFGDLDRLGKPIAEGPLAIDGLSGGYRGGHQFEILFLVKHLLVYRFGVSAISEAWKKLSKASKMLDSAY